jgi:hypothetical protein
VENPKHEQRNGQSQPETAAKGMPRIRGQAPNEGNTRNPARESQLSVPKAQGSVAETAMRQRRVQE